MSNWKTLLVEDEDALRQALIVHLQRIPLAVEAASNKQGALKLVENHNFQLAILDLNLPDGHGLQVFQALKQKSPQCYTIVISGEPNLESTIQALNQGVDAYLTKPFRTETLESLIHQASRNLSLQQEKERLLSELQKTKSFYEDLLNSTQEAILVLDLDFHIRFWNQSARQMLGSSQSNPQKRNLQDYVVDGYKVLHHLYKKLLLGKKAGWHPIQVRSETGDLLDLNMSGNFLYNASGQVEGIIVTLENTTFRNELFRQLVRREKLNTIINLARVLAHEIRNPINILSGRLQLLSKELKQKKYQRSFETLNRQVERIAHITDQLAKFELSPLDTIPESFSIIEFMERFLAEQAGQFQNLTIHLEYPPRLRDILLAGNPAQFSDAFTYLFEALDQRAEKPCTVGIRCYLSRSLEERAYLELQMECSRHMALENVLEPFSAEKTPSQPSLSSALMQIIFTNYGGDVLYRPQESQTSILRLRFPVYEIHSQLEDAKPGKPIGARTKKRKTKK